MINEEHVRRLFQQYLPDNVEIVFVPREVYLIPVMINPMVRKQINMGIYHPDTIAREFLGWAMSLTGQGKVHACLDLLRDLSVGLDADLIDILIRHTAAHEAHHFAHHHVASTDVAMQVSRELECDDQINADYPALAIGIQLVYLSSDVFRTVFARCAS